MFRQRCAELGSVSACFVIALLLGAPDRSEAASLSYAIDLSFPFEPLGESNLEVQGTFREAARFRIDSDLLPADTITFVPYSRVDSFSLSLPTLSLGQREKDGGSCLTDVRPPCGLLFVGVKPLTFVGQFSIADPSGRFNFRLDNTGPGLASPGPLFQSASIEDLGPGLFVTVTSGFAVVRPVPEPASMLLLTAGGIAVGNAVRRRKAKRSMV
jgi:hypothetical protein